MENRGKEEERQESCGDTPRKVFDDGDVVAAQK